MTAARHLRRIIATTDFHSAFDGAVPMLTHLHARRHDSLVVDCGDFFEGTGYYRLGQGRIERDVLVRLYDAVAPGNHGWVHHFESDLHGITVCANAVDAETGNPLFRPARLVNIGTRRVAVTGVIGPQAFNAIPADQRAGHRVTEPVQALRELMLTHHHQADSWVVLSHSGFDEDLKLAAACPFLDVVFAGHCHSERPGPVPVGDTLVLKGRELAAGYALAEPVGAGWVARVDSFPPTAVLPRELAPVQEAIDAVHEELRTPLGPLRAPYANGLLDRRALLTDVAGRLHNGLGAEAVLLNETALRSPRLGTVLTQGDLLAIEPFDNQLVHAHVPGRFLTDPAALLAHLTAQTGPVVSAPRPLPDRLPTVLTTGYLADAYLGGRTRQAGIRLSQAVQRTLTDGESR
ncbi:MULTISPECIES: metallophosphoesterase [Streptomyces]|uniref:5-nucleotidase n=1 Tax=Streptomyces venezuelae (strain ATCC 10712 / CBS 650.69 / DSM 40230 / JCM 4526 / NBRC 13096 / PD 04745) TaxID=953739 RepID=F2RC99_STRVP|nr:metallophosphoesterase [Streptomyces venezuelae]APE24839.1 phosphatase [Streptomyces venezuelae]QES02184.1 bifunctional metallophosphatase/5'-nucleotidase [Streptomyces venezuelae ATCC 10712]CCA59350.1 5-nucleotidase [Streptomyces venezuelae ATCC 10712]